MEVRRPASASPVSAGVRWFVDQGVFLLKDGAAYALELEWDHGREGKSHRFDADVPLVVRW